MQWNGLKSNDLKIGQRLTIYPSNHVASSTANTSSASSKTSITSNLSGNIETYIVKSGDSLWSISQKFPGVSVQNIKDWNDISGSKLKPGMKLKISKG